MSSGPGFSKPAHQYGQSFGDQAEVLDGGGPFIPQAPQALVSEQPGRQLAGIDLSHCAILGEPSDEERAAWAGKGFTLPYADGEFSGVLLPNQEPE